MIPEKEQRIAEIHTQLTDMVSEEESLMDELEQLGDKTYYIPPESVERTRENISAIIRVTRERDLLLATNQRLMREAAEDRKAIQALKLTGRQLEDAVEELLTEFISKKRAANWGIINGAGVAFVKAVKEHAAAIQRAHGQPGGELQT